MANKSVLELAVETGKWDSGLKKGMKALDDFTTASGGLQQALGKDSDKMQKFVQMMGSMESMAKTAKGQMSDYKSTIEQLTMQYNRMTEAQQQTIGQEYLNSIEQLKKKYYEVSQEQQEMNRSLQNTNGTVEDSSGVIDKLTKRFTVNIDAIKLFEKGLQTAGGALNVAKDAFFNNEEQLDEWGRVVESSHSLYTGFLNALNTGDISGYLRNINQIVQAARDAYDALDALGTYNAFNQINIERTRTNMTESIADYRGGQGSKEAVKAAGEAYKKELQDRKRLENEAYLAAVKRVAAERGVSAKDLTDALSGTYGHYQDLKNVKPTGERMVSYSGGMFGGGGSYLEKYAQNRQEKLGEALRHLNDTELQNLQALGAQAQRTGTEIAQVDKQLTRVLNGRQPGESGGGGKGGGKGGGSTTKIPALKVEISESRTELQLLKDELKTVENSMAPYGKLTDEWKEMNAYAGELRIKIKEMNGEVGLKGISTLDMVTVPTASDMTKRADQRIKDFKIQEPTKQEDKTLENTQDLVGGLSSVASGLNQMGIELPDGVQKVLGGMQGLMSIIQGVQTILDIFTTTTFAAQTVSLTANTTTLAANTAALGALTGAIVTNTATNLLPFPFANGGVVKAAGGYRVPGRTFSGDMVPARLNAGELVLNQAQAGVIANALQDREFGGGSGTMQPYVEGERVYLGMENMLKRKGKGEIVTTSMLRRLGLM